jgi:hypothetical protein
MKRLKHFIGFNEEKTRAVVFLGMLEGFRSFGMSDDPSQKGSRARGNVSS